MQRRLLKGQAQKSMILSKLKKNHILVILLLFGFLTFVYTYWANIYRPGALYKGGWYEIWADQKRYYTQSKAIADFRLNKETFYYPILYPLLGSLLIRFIPTDPFFLINIGLFLATMVLMYLLIEKVFGKEKAIFSVMLLLISNRFVYDFVTPWTTNITTPLFLASFFILYSQSFSMKYLIIMSTLTGAAFLSRYTDIIFFLPLLIGFIFKDSKVRLKQNLKNLSIAGFVLSFFIIIFFSFNLATSNTLLGPYISRVTSRFVIDLSPVTIFEKTLGFFVDSFTLHRQIEFFSTPAITVYPTLIFVLFFFSLIIFQWQKLTKSMRIVTASIILSAALWYISYIPYGAIAPYTLKNLALHYIKPWVPLSIFFTIIIFDKLLTKKDEYKLLLKIIIASLIILIFIPLLIHRFQPKLLDKKDWLVTASTNKNEAIKILDGRLDRAWSSKRPRKNGDNIIIDMKKNYMISRLRLMDQPPFAATDFDTLLSQDGKDWQPLARNYSYNVRREYGWDIVGYMKKARYIKLFLNEESKSDPWQIKEIDVFGY